MVVNGLSSSHRASNFERRDKAPSERREVEVPRLQEPLGGFIFVCNDETMPEDFQRQLFGLPRNYIDMVKHIRKGMPLFLYNYSTRCLHGVFEASSDGGMNLEPDAWENRDGKVGTELTSRFPAQVRVRVRDIRAPLEEGEFRPLLFHYEGKKFRLELSHSETAKLLKLFDQNADFSDGSSDENGNEWEKVRGKSKVNRVPPPVLNFFGRRQGVNATSGSGEDGRAVLNSFGRRQGLNATSGSGEDGRGHESRADLAQQWRSDASTSASLNLQADQLKDKKDAGVVDACTNKLVDLQTNDSNRDLFDGVKSGTSSRATAAPSYVAALKSGIRPESTMDDSTGRVSNGTHKVGSQELISKAGHTRESNAGPAAMHQNGNHDTRQQAGNGAMLGRLHDADPAVNSQNTVHSSGESHPQSPSLSAESMRRNHAEPIGKNSYRTQHGKPSNELQRQKDEGRKQPSSSPMVPVHQYGQGLIPLHPSPPFTALPHVPLLTPIQIPAYGTQVNEAMGYRPVQRSAVDSDAGVYSPVQHGTWSPQQPVMLVGGPFPSHALAANVESNFEVLHGEILEFARTARPSPAARARAEAAVECVRRGVKQLWPGADVEVFGSFATGLCLPHSDVDVVVLDAPPLEFTEFSGARASIPLIRSLAAAFKDSKWCGSLMTIETAAMPVIKLRCNPSALFPEVGSGASPVAIDVTIGGNSGQSRTRDNGKGKKKEPAKFIHNGAAAREYVIEKLQQLPALAPLVLLMKSYLHHKGFNDVYTGGLGSFSLTLMLVFYLEQVPVSWSPGPAIVSSSGASVASSLSESSDSDDETNLTDSTSTSASDDGSARLSSSASPTSASVKALPDGEALIERAWRIVDELLASLQAPGAPNLGSLLIGFVHIFGQELDFSRTRIVLKGANGGSGGMFALEPSAQPTCLWIDDPLRPGLNVGAGSFAMWNVQAAMRAMLFVLAKPQSGASVPQSRSSRHAQKRPFLPHLDQLFQEKVCCARRSPDVVFKDYETSQQLVKQVKVEDSEIT